MNNKFIDELNHLLATLHQINMTVIGFECLKNDYSLKSRVMPDDTCEICHSAHRPTRLQHQHRGVAEAATVS